ncbi:MAG: histidine phosphatase family protein [Romboutsia sp.]|uniref:histidine phosphatase family protein n=1 Tax=Romboutsia sp. TaxID=1965302 RepID=UPI003F2CDDED
MIKLILVRHAVTNDNEESRLSGHIDSTLSEEGIKQVKKLTKYLEQYKIDKIFTTTSKRTKDTVEPLANIKNIDIIEKDTLKEISFGDFEGITFDEIQSNHSDEFDKMISQGYEYIYPNGESLIESYYRVSKEIENIISENDNKSILICSHGGTIRNIISYLISNSYEYHWNFRIDNASVTIIEVENRFAVINTMNNKNFD